MTIDRALWLLLLILGCIAIAVWIAHETAWFS